MSYAKLKIEREKGSPGSFNRNGAIEVLFNPNQISHSKSQSWTPIRSVGTSTSRPGFALMYQSAAPQTLTLELFFDTYAQGGAAPRGIGLLPSVGAKPESVIPKTNEIANLASIDQELHRPPVCRIFWGGGQALFQGVLQQASRTLLLFLDDGTPVRATMNCTFLEYPDEKGVERELHSADVAKRYVVRPGDTLISIAASHYNDASQWRRIADANAIDNPRRLVPGQALAIPRVR